LNLERHRYPEQVGRTGGGAVSTAPEPAADPAATRADRPAPDAETGNRSPLDELLALNASGRLAAEYPAVRRLTADLTGADLLTAGRLLARLDPDDVLRRHPATPQVSVALTGLGTLSMLVAPLTAHLAQHGVLVRATVGAHDGYAFDRPDPGDGIRAGEAGRARRAFDSTAGFDEAAGRGGRRTWRKRPARRSPSWGI
jgi:hypothetical protein